LDLEGHAIEIRVNAEDPRHDFRPTPTTISTFRAPGGPGIRVDSGVYAGYTIPPDYDSLMAKLISWAPDRNWARVRALRALHEFLIEGPASTVPFAGAVLEHPLFIDGRVGTVFVGRHLEELQALSLSVASHTQSSAEAVQRGEGREFDVEVDRKLFRVRVAEVRHPARKSPSPRTSRGMLTRSSNSIVSPMHGKVMAVKIEVGADVEPGQTAFVIEAMKMENEVAVERAGTVARVDVKAGDTVESGQVLAALR
jgi:acetyl-CoA/propionyl-CoA carboxylase, biotin carboxylase, biotin carboxyl carrier protein